MTPRYVAFEGIEGAGKSTLARLLASRLDGDGVDVVTVREPGGTGAGEQIRRILLTPGGVLEPWTEALLFAAARAQLAKEVVGPALAAGRAVVADRSVYSSLAYQGGGRGLGIDAVRAVNEPGLGDVWPGVVVLLRIGPDQGLGRQSEADRIGGEGAAFQAVVAEAFDLLARLEKDRFVILDAERSLDELAEEAYREVRERW